MTDRRTLTYLAGGIGAVLVIVLIIGLSTGGLDKVLRAKGRAEVENFNGARKQLAKVKVEVERALTSEPELFKIQGFDSMWPQRLEAVDQQLRSATKDRDRLQSLLAENEKEKSGEVEQAIETVAAVRLAALADLADMQNTARQLLRFKKELGEQLSKMDANYRAIESHDLGGLQVQVTKAISDWPQKQADLNRRLAVLTEGPKLAEQTWASTAEARQAAADGNASNEHLNELMKAVSQLESVRQTLDGAKQQLPTLIDQLDWSWDKILTDMDIREGTDVTFHHKFKIIKTHATASEDSPAEQKITEQWQMVSKSTFESMKKNQGMAVEHKPAGKYDHEAERVTQPPGYAYMCRPDQQRNRYGHWDRGGGTSFWVFYGQYALMRNVFGGPRYGHVTVNNYGGYDRARQSGRTYYGRDSAGQQRYGSSGSVTKSRYSSSQYVRTNGFSNSRYVRSKGTYRGSRYEQPRRTSSSRSYRSSRSSGSRSFGGK